MTRLARNALRFALAATAGTLCLFFNDNMSTAQRSSLISQADARMTVPGEARRFARRAARRSYCIDCAYNGYLQISNAYAASPRRYPRTYYGTLAAFPGYFGFLPTYPGWSYEGYGSYPLGYYGGYPSYYER